MNANHFFKYCCGIALVAGTLLFGSAALIYSTTPAHADAPNTTYANGKYQMSLQAYTGSNGNVQYYILVWDTETGKSKFYAGNPDNGLVSAKSKFQLPSNPLD